MSRPKVYFVHQPVRFDKVTRCMVPISNLETASEYGDIVFALPGTDRPSLDPETVLPRLRDFFATFTAQDYLALAGDLHLVVWAGILISRRIGQAPLQLLKWYGPGNRYLVQVARI